MKIKVNAKNMSIAILVERFQDYEKFDGTCGNCNNYGKNWACPPVNFDREKYLQKYKNACIFTTQILFDEQQLSACAGNQNAYKYAEPIVCSVRSALREALLEVEKTTDGTMLFGGPCSLCDECSRASGESCVMPDDMRYNMDTFGFDFSKLARELFGIELLWASEGLPEYYAITALVLMNEDDEYGNILRSVYSRCGFELDN